MLRELEIKIKRFLYGEIGYYRKQGVTIGENCSMLGKIEFGSEPYLISIGDNVRITNGVTFVTHDGGVHVIRNLYNLPNIDKFGEIKIGNNVFIGTKTIIMPNVTIGNNVIIGAGSIVTRDIQDNSVACGIPAKVISNIETYFNKNKDSCLETKQLNYKEKKNLLWHIYKEKM